MYYWNVHRDDPRHLREVLLENPQFLAANPDVLAAARNVLRDRQLEAEYSERKRLLAGRWQRFTHVAFSPSLGNPSAHAVLIEFTDYGCEPCKASAGPMLSAIEAHPDVRVAVMLLPTSGAISEFAARVGYAAYRQNPLQFVRFHELLMQRQGDLTAAGVLDEARAAGLDVEQIQDELGTSDVRAYLAQVKQFADDLHVVGVPTLVFGSRVVSGGTSGGQLAELLQAH